MNLFIDFSNEKDHPSIHDRYLSGRYSQTYPSRKQDTPEFFFPGTGIRTEERGSSSNLVVISFLFQLSSSFLILLKVVDMFAF